MNLLLAFASGSPPPSVSTAPVPPPHHITLSWMALGILVSSILTWLIFRWRSVRLKRLENSPRKLWRDLCLLHKLSWSERQLAARVARRLKLQVPARLFLEADLWRQASETEPAHRRRELQRLVVLRNKLFDVPNSGR